MDGIMEENNSKTAILSEGIYETVISQEIKKVIDESNNDKVYETEEFDLAESPAILSEYLCRIIRNSLEDDKKGLVEKSDFLNKLLSIVVPDDEGVQIADKEKYLSRVYTSEKKAEKTATKTKEVRPLTGFRVSNLFTGRTSPIPLFSEIQKDIQSADRIYLIVSFLKLSGLNLIYDDLVQFCKVPGHELKVITTTYCGVTEAKAVERLSGLPNTEIRISYDTKNERLHAKSYIFERNSGFSTAYIGSSNLSKSAQTDGLEWNIRVTNVENPHIIKTAIANFKQYWDSDNFEDFSEGGIEKFREQLSLNQTGHGNRIHIQRYTVLPHQKVILDKLMIERELGINKNLVVAATGTGKTVISAFDYQLFSEKNPHHNRLLFVAHREEILRQAMSTYQGVLQDYNFGDIWTGRTRPQNIEHLFVTVQTFRSNFNDVFSKLGPDYYDYIVVDEVHHIVASSYRDVVSHFNPQILLGLTATSERMDGESLLPDFSGRISAEIRLPKALEEGLLTPFNYLCIADSVDLSSDDLWSGNKYITEKLSEKLCDSSRAALVVDKLRYYLADENKCKALCFCADKRHAKFMSDFFKNCELKADYLTSDNQERREELNRSLAQGKINYLFVVDMFNEGVDIPAVDTVLFLRPTESLTIYLQQLGRGLRLSPGKQELVVFDFIAQLNKKYDFASRFRALLTKSTNVREQINKGFTMLPFGCTIHMEEKAKQFVLQNIESAIYTENKLIKMLQAESSCPSLKEFVMNNSIDIHLIYKGNRCWTSLKCAAGKCQYDDTDITKFLTKGIGNLLHINSLPYLQYISNVMDANGNYSPQNDREKSFEVMLYYALFQNTITKNNFKSIPSALRQLKDCPLFVSEIKELISYLTENLDTKTFSIGKGMPDALEQYSCYTKDEIFAIFGEQNATKTMRNFVSGAYNVKNLNTELLFVTLNKSDKDFSPTTQYDDYIVSEKRFHWQSQNNDSHNGKGERFVNQKTNGKKFLLFVREAKRDGYGNTMPFYCFGFVSYISSYGDRPMNIDWELEYKIMPQFLKAV